MSYLTESIMIYILKIQRLVILFYNNSIDTNVDKHIIHYYLGCSNYIWIVIKFRWKLRERPSLGFLRPRECNIKNAIRNLSVDIIRQQLYLCSVAGRPCAIKSNSQEGFKYCQVRKRYQPEEPGITIANISPENVNV